MKKLLPLLLFIFANFSSFATIEFNENCKKSYEAILRFNFQKASKAIQFEQKNHPENTVVYYLENFKTCLNLFNSESLKDYERLKSLKKKYIGVIDQEPASNPYRNYLIAEINVHWAMVSFKSNDFVKAAREMNEAYNYLSWNERLHPDFAPNKKILSILHIAIGLIPDEYRWLARFIGYQGTTEQGIREFKQFYASCKSDENLNYLLTEAYILKAMIAMHVTYSDVELKDFIAFLKNTNSEYSDSPVTQYALVSSLMYLGRNDEAIACLEKTRKLYYLDYLKGLCYLYKQDGRAEQFFTKYIKYGVRHFVKSAHQKIAWSHLIHGNKEEYANEINKARKYGYKLFEADKAALREAEKEQTPNVDLLKGRLLFDGGYYEKSLAYLRSLENKDVFIEKKHHLEYIYRLGRIYDKLNNENKAIEYYKLTIELGGDSDTYFAANSALKLGAIYEEQKRVDQAILYYTLCTTLNTSVYSSIAQQAKNSLKRIQKRQLKK